MISSQTTTRSASIALPCRTRRENSSFPSATSRPPSTYSWHGELSGAVSMDGRVEGGFVSPVGFCFGLTGGRAAVERMPTSRFFNHRPRSIIISSGGRCRGISNTLADRTRDAERGWTIGKRLGLRGRVFGRKATCASCPLSEGRPGTGSCREERADVVLGVFNSVGVVGSRSAAETGEGAAEPGGGAADAAPTPAQ